MSHGMLSSNTRIFKPSRRKLHEPNHAGSLNMQSIFYMPVIKSAIYATNVRLLPCRLSKKHETVVVMKTRVLGFI